MRILIINPNSDSEMTKAIEETANTFVDPSVKILCKSTCEAPKFIETYEDQVKAAPGMIGLVRENEKKVDGFIIACHCDPNLDVIKEITCKPVVGIGEASMKIASMLGHSFSVISMTEHSVPNKESLVHKYHLEDVLASVRAPLESHKKLNQEEKFLETAKLAITEDKAEVIVLGCAGMLGLDKRLQKKLKAPVLDGIKCALIILVGLIKADISTSKIKKYNPS